MFSVFCGMRFAVLKENCCTVQYFFSPVLPSWVNLNPGFIGQ